MFFHIEFIEKEVDKEIFLESTKNLNIAEVCCVVIHFQKNTPNANGQRKAATVCFLRIKVCIHLKPNKPVVERTK